MKQITGAVVYKRALAVVFFAGDVAPVTEWLCTPTNYDIMRGVRKDGLDQHPADKPGYSLAIGERGRPHYDPSSSRGIN